MPTIAIVGAGPGLGASIARRFGRQGFDVALVARSEEHLDELTRQLGTIGVHAAGFPADVTDRPSLTDALRRASDRFGGVDVLEYSPAPHVPVAGMEPVTAADVTVENAQPQIEYYLYGAITAVRAVLPGMLERGQGTLFFTTGASSTVQYPRFGNIAIGSGALRNWALNLHVALADRGVYVAHVPLATFIGSGGPETQPDTIAEVYWALYTERRDAERLYSTMDLGD